MLWERGFIQQILNDYYVPGSMMGVGDMSVLSKLSVKFTVWQLTPHMYVADVHFQGKILKMKTTIIFQSCLKYLYWLYPKENFIFWCILSYF